MYRVIPQRPAADEAAGAALTDIAAFTTQEIHSWKEGNGKAKGCKKRERARERDRGKETQKGRGRGTSGLTSANPHLRLSVAGHGGEGQLLEDSQDYNTKNNKDTALRGETYRSCLKEHNCR